MTGAEFSPTVSDSPFLTHRTLVLNADYRPWRCGAASRAR